MSDSYPVSVIITTFNEGEYLDRLLRDLAEQDCSGLDVEIVLLEAGNYPVSRAREQLGARAESLVFLQAPGMPRTLALNTMVEHAHGSLIIRLDARSHIAPDYLRRITDLSRATNAENVGGVQSPIGLSESQQLIAEVMKCPLSLGGARFRKAAYEGCGESVYLGAFNVSKIHFRKWFDEQHPLISEDSDLNHRIRQAGGTIYIDSSIVVEHYPREDLLRFFRLCYNYGVGRGLFVIKNRKFSALRQVAPPIALFSVLLMGMGGFAIPALHWALTSTIALYVLVLSVAALRITRKPSAVVKVICALAGCHLFWTVGLVLSPVQYRRDCAITERKSEAEFVVLSRDR